jgi:hypothetical protein
MKYATAVGRLRTVADDLSSQSKRADAAIVEAFVYGELLETPQALDRISLAFVVGLPPEELT